jgi:glycopeptide antibiotics resistance protein
MTLLKVRRQSSERNVINMVKWLPYFIEMTGLLVWLKSLLPRLSKLTRWQMLTLISAAVYLIVVGYLTLAPTSYAFVTDQEVAPLMVGTAPVNLVPFWSTTADFYQNVVMMLPMGVYIGLMVPQFNWRGVVVAGGLISIAIETMQFFLDLTVGLSRWVDINDVITNTLGVLVGWLILKLLAATILKTVIEKLTIHSI